MKILVKILFLLSMEALALIGGAIIFKNNFAGISKTTLFLILLAVTLLYLLVEKYIRLVTSFILAENEDTNGSEIIRKETNQ